MPTIHVAKAFTLTLDPRPLGEGRDEAGKQVTVYQGEPDKRFFATGEHEVEDAIAEHWFVKAHLEGAVEEHPQHLLYQQAVPLAEQAARQGAQAAAPTPAGAAPEHAGGVVQHIQQPPALNLPPPADIPLGGVPATLSHEAGGAPQAASRTGMVPEGAHYFAGKPQQDKQVPEQTGVSFLGTTPVQPPPPKRTSKER